MAFSREINEHLVEGKWSAAREGPGRVDVVILRVLKGDRGRRRRGTGEDKDGI